MPNIRLKLQYDGTCYHGWQAQRNVRTVQGELIAAIKKMTGEEVDLVGASRTDKGVHALGQVANFHTTRPLPALAFLKGLNSLTSDDILILEAEVVPEDFNIRFDAKSKIYVYQILNARTPSIYHRRFCWFLRDRLDIEAMREAAKYLEGQHDFKSFQASSPDSGSTIRTIYNIRITQRRDFIWIFIKANAFLYKMVRNIVGTLVEIGQKKREIQEMSKILAARDRKAAGITAPAQGLFLARVYY
ncbi:MAG TPA: tRNA pseudouridine(38-40) synthase TruA [Candidatus Limnocylindrales bacterium]|nr:tRNA pseudouridine(38-40) synthase TruA [Candidatus Limnocylindrales bacterium]